MSVTPEPIAEAAVQPPPAPLAILDFHGFERSMMVPHPPPHELRVPVTRRLFGAGISASDILEGNEELLQPLVLRFTRHSVSPAGLRYTCAGCLLCRPGLLDSYINKLARETARAVLTEQIERRRADRAEQAAERDTRRRARETVKKRPVRRRRSR